MGSKMKPHFSIIIPTYNRAKRLNRALGSVSAQIFTDFEVLIMDDGSTDDTKTVVESFQDPRFRYEWAPNSGGPATPRNRGIDAASADWICFLDADDWWTADKLQVCFDCINNNVDLIYHDLEIITEQPRLFRRKTIRSWQVKPPVLLDLLLNGNAISNSSVVVRKVLLEQIGGINQSVEMIASEDYNTWLRIAKITEQFIYLPRRLGFYLQHDQNISKKDMSIPSRSAVAKFVTDLNEQQKLKLEAGFRYTKSRFNFSSGNYAEAKLDLLFALLHGNLVTRTKGMIMLIKMGMNSFRV